ncbi:MAG TPA: hypothetical protein VNO54_23090, partial [Streptosporangiaceae bacterium]|nr:hypothetical protein [Streptosporangiaceae bacterium]
VLARSGSATPVYVSGYDQGYEEIPFPGLYDPMTAGDVSPLLNAFETGAVTGSPCPMVDSFRVDMAPEPRAVKLLTALAEVCDRTQDPAPVRCALNELSWSLLDCTLRAAPRKALMRSAAMAHRHSASLGPTTAGSSSHRGSRRSGPIGRWLNGVAGARRASALLGSHWASLRSAHPDARYELQARSRRWPP